MTRTYWTLDDIMYNSWFYVTKIGNFSLSFVISKENAWKEDNQQWVGGRRTGYFTNIISLIFWIYKWGNRPRTVLRLKSYCSDAFFFFQSLDALGLLCCTWPFPSYCQQGYSVAVVRLLIVLTSSLQNTAPRECWFRTCGTGGYVAPGTCILPWLESNPCPLHGQAWF